MGHPLPRRRAAVFACAASAAAAIGWCAGPAAAQVTTWTNATGNRLWVDPGNWNNGLPQSTGRAVLVGPAVPIDLGGATRTISQLEANADGFSINNGTLAALVVQGAPQDLSAATFTANATLVASGTLLTVQRPTFGGRVFVNGGIGPGAFDLRSIFEVTLASPAQHAGETTVLGEMTIDGSAGGAITGSSRIDLQGAGTILLNAPAAGGGAPQGMLGDAIPIRMTRAGLSLRNPGGGAVAETVGPIELWYAQSDFAVEANAELGVAQLTRSHDSTATVALAPGGRMLLATPPALPPGGVGPADRPVVPWLLARPAASFLTYDSAAGLRPLDPATEYAPSLSAAASPLANVRLSTPGETLASSKTVNALLTVGPAGVDVAAGATLSLASGALALTAAAPGTAARPITGGGTLHAPGELVVWAVAENFGASTGAYELEVPIAAGKLTKAGNATLRLMRPSDVGEVSVQAGELVAAVPGAFGSGSLRLDGGAMAFAAGSHAFGGLATPGSTSGGTIRVEGGATVTLAGPVAGRGFVKNGPGTLRIDGEWVEAQPSLSSNDGVVEVNGTIGLDTPVPGGLVFGRGIRGNGAIYASVSGDVSPGPDGRPGRLTVATLNRFGGSPPGTRLLVEVEGDVPGVSFDQLVVTRSAQLSDPLFPTIGLSVALDVQMRYQPAIGTTFRIIDNQSSMPITGRFTGLAPNALFTAGGVQLQITYAGGTGNDVVLTVVPEPSAGGAVIAGASTLLARRRRGRSKPKF